MKKCNITELKKQMAALQQIADNFQECKHAQPDNEKAIREKMRQECIEAVLKKKSTLGNPNAMAGYGCDKAIQAIQEIE